MVFSSTSITTFGKQFTLNKSVYSNNFIIFMNPQLNLHNRDGDGDTTPEPSSASAGPYCGWWSTYCKTRYIWKVCSKYDIFGQRHTMCLGPGYRCKHYANNLSWCHTNPPPAASASNIHALINFKMTQLVHSVGQRTITNTSTSTRRVGKMENKNKEPFLRSECLCSWLLAAAGMCASAVND